MINYMNIVKGELMKSFKGKAIIIMISLVVGITIMMGLIYGLTVQEYAKLYPPETEEIILEDLLDGIKLEIVDIDNEYYSGNITKYKHKLLTYQHQGVKLYVEYLIANDLAYGEVDTYQGEDMLRNATFQNLMFFTLSSAMMIVAIIASILAAGAITDELSNGTMRLLLICPVNRTKLIFAKLAAILLQLSMVIGVIIITSIVMGLLMYPSAFKDVLLIVNASTTILVPFVVAVLLQSILLLVYGMMIAVIVLAFVTVFRSKVFGIVFGTILSLDILSAALLIRPSLIRIFSYTIFTNMNFNGFFSLSGNNYGQLNLSMALLVYIINIVVLLALSSLLFKQRDIN